MCAYAHIEMTTMTMRRTRVAIDILTGEIRQLEKKVKALEAEHAALEQQEAELAVPSYSTIGRPKLHLVTPASPASPASPTHERLAFVILRTCIDHADALYKQHVMLELKCYMLRRSINKWFAPWPPAHAVAIGANAEAVGGYSIAIGANAM